MHMVYFACYIVYYYYALLVVWVCDVIVQKGLTALHHCIFRGQLAVMRTLVKEFNQDPDVIDKVSHGCMWDTQAAI